MKKFTKTFEKTIILCRFSSLGIGMTKVHCTAMASICSVKQQHSNPHIFRISILLAFFSAKSASPTVFRMRIPGLAGNISVGVWPIALLVRIRCAMECNRNYHKFHQSMSIVIFIDYMYCNHVIMTSLEPRALSYQF